MSAGRMGGCCGGGNPRAWGWPVGAAPSVRLAWWCTRGQKAALAEILHTRGGEAVLFSGKSWPSWLAIVPCVFVPVELAAMARRARGAAVSGRPSLSDRDGRGAIVRVASAVRRWGRRPKCCHGSVMLDVDVCAGISNGLWPRGASLPMVHCQRRITRGSPRRAGLRRCRFYGRIPPTQAMPVFQAGRPPATGSFGCAPDYPVELDWRGPLADCWFQQWSGVVLSWVSDQYHASDEGLQ